MKILLSKLTVAQEISMLASLCVAIIIGFSAATWIQSPVHSYAIYPGPYLAFYIIVSCLIHAFSSRFYTWCAIYTCMLLSICGDIIGDILLVGVPCAQVGLYITHVLPKGWRYEKWLLWTIFTYVQSVWFYDVCLYWSHMTFFGQAFTT